MNHKNGENPENGPKEQPQIEEEIKVRNSINDNNINQRSQSTMYVNLDASQFPSTPTINEPTVRTGSAKHMLG